MEVDLRFKFKLVTRPHQHDKGSHSTSRTEVAEWDA